MSLPSLILAFILGPTISSPSFLAMSVLLIELPMTSVEVTIGVSKDTGAMGHGVKERTFVEIAYGVDKGASTVSITQGPITLVGGTIIPFHFASAISESSFPLTSIQGTISIGILLIASLMMKRMKYSH